MAVVALISLILISSTILLYRYRRQQQDVRLQADILKRLYQRKTQQQSASLKTITGTLNVPISKVRQALHNLSQQGLVQLHTERFLLTKTGEHQAQEYVRGHRVLETFLAERSGHPLRLLHRLADRWEHRLKAPQVERMVRDLGHPQRDPHGDLIPQPGQKLQTRSAMSLADCPSGYQVRVVHIEDEPDLLYDELATVNLLPGSELQVLDNSRDQLRLRTSGQVFNLTKLAAGQVDVLPSELEAGTLAQHRTLAQLPLQQPARIVMLSAALRGVARRRLLDLGFTPGAQVKPIMRNALGGDPTAYLIRHSKVALRKDQSRHILVIPTNSEHLTEEVAA